MIDDGSCDGTLSEIKRINRTDRRIRYVSLSRNFGKENAMLAGFDCAGGDCAVIMDADLQHPPSLIPMMLRHWEEGFDDVYAERRNRGRESWLRRRLSMAYYRILQRMAKIEILPNVGDFRLLDRKCIDSMRRLRETQRYTKGLYCWIGFRKKKIVFDQGDRVHLIAHRAEGGCDVLRRHASVHFAVFAAFDDDVNGFAAQLFGKRQGFFFRFLGKAQFFFDALVIFVDNRLGRFDRHLFGDQEVAGVPVVQLDDRPFFAVSLYILKQ